MFRDHTLSPYRHPVMAAAVLLAILSVALSPSARADTLRLVSTGSGFLVDDRHVVTNAHVATTKVDGRDSVCRAMSVEGGATTGRAVIVQVDQRADLALLRLAEPVRQAAPSAPPGRKLEPVAESAPTSSGPRVFTGEPPKTAPPAAGANSDQQSSQPTAAAIGGSLAVDAIRPGEDVFVVGYPSGYGVSTALKISKGVAGARIGAANDSSRFQLDASANPGNSGGPVVDEHGRIVGVLVSGIAKLQGHNFAIKAANVAQFLQSNGVAPRLVDRGPVLPGHAIFEDASRYTLIINCFA